MLLSVIAKDLDCAFTGEDTEISSVEYDSRKVTPGSLFCCLRGEVTDGHKYAAMAKEKGAAALLCEHETGTGLPELILPDARRGMADASACFYGHPEREMTLLAVTGTNGKTSTTYMVKAAAEHAGLKTGLIGTIQNLIGDEPVYTERTTPESRDLFALLRRMKDAGVNLVVMEVSSHALVQRRVEGLPFRAGAFTNLTQDHLDYHKTFEAYRDAKKLLFKQCEEAFVNADDPSGAYMAEGLSIPVSFFGMEKEPAYSASQMDITPHGASFLMRTPEGEAHISLNISGLFSVYNALTAACLAHAAGIPLRDIEAGLNALPGVNGRLDRVDAGNLPFTVYVDYAHTPDALINVMKTARTFTKGRLICLFGCGGDRDHTKRPVMGRAAGEFSDYAILTDDNPRSEDPLVILAAAEEGLKEFKTPYKVIPGRKIAIGEAIRMAEPGDVVLITGKGHETYQEINGVRHHFDDKEIAAAFMKERL